MEVDEKPAQAHESEQHVDHVEKEENFFAVGAQPMKRKRGRPPLHKKTTPPKEETGFFDIFRSQGEFADFPGTPGGAHYWNPLLDALRSQSDQGASLDHSAGDEQEHQDDEALLVLTTTP